MCRPAKCGTCSGKTWFGCGLHVPSVMDPIPKDQWCSCAKPGESQYPPKGNSPCTIL
ncbi:hypothetical protein BGX38DRAFT_1128235 [Terfezia claveryi]|nr:hypothetical protein BGX38DRAFT_1128235 [Terfezia claveryi]